MLIRSLITFMVFFLLFGVQLNAESNETSPVQVSLSDINQSVNTSLSENTPLLGTYWKLVSLFSEDVESVSMFREAHIVFKSLDKGQGTFKGASGCNAMLGTYESNEHNLSIHYNKIAMTRMACPEENIEINFLKAMKHTRRWNIEDDYLHFVDINATVLARFRAIDPKL